MNTHDEKSISKVITYLKKPRHIDDLCAKFDVHKLTIKRWLELLRNRGYRVVRDGTKPDSPYYIVETRKKAW